MDFKSKDILDFNVTLGALRSILNTILTEDDIDIEFLRKNVAINKFDLVSESIGFLGKLQIINISEKGVIISEIKVDELNLIRAVILNRITKSEDPYVRYLPSFIDQFLSTKEYYEIREVWRILATVRSKENVKSPYEELDFKFRQLLRLMTELGLMISYKRDKTRAIIPVIDPSLVLEFINHMKKFKGSIYEIVYEIKTNYLPCCDNYGKPYSPLIKSLESLECMGFLRLSRKSDAGLPISSKEYNFMEVTSREN